jgi:transcriptional regulator GlxA family with amidase domain
MPRNDIYGANNDRPETQRFGILLLPDFALMSYAALIEPLRAANALAGAELYAWTHISPTGDPVRASNGVSLMAEASVSASPLVDAVFVCAGGNPALFRHAATFRWLHRLARDGVILAGISGGPFILARAGVLDGYRCTLHWEHVPAFREAFPDIQVESGVYTIDRQRLSSAGGVAALDLSVALIAAAHGTALAGQVRDWFISTQWREGGDAQRLPLQHRFGTDNPKVLAVLAAMEQHVEEPMARAALARLAGVSLRQLERLFLAHLNATIVDTYHGFRLDRARQLLRQTPLSVVDVAVACGFASASHFSRRFKARFGESPRSASHHRAPPHVA